MEPNRSMVQMNCMLRVETQSPGWEKALTKVIKRVKGVSYSIDGAHGIIRISGEINPYKLLTDIRKAGKHTELIHADCGVAHSQPVNGHVYGYDGRYGHVEPHHHPYPHYCIAQPGGHGHGCIQFQYDTHQFNGLPAPLPIPHQRHAPSHICPAPSAPPLEYDPYNSCTVN